MVGREACQFGFRVGPVKSSKKIGLAPRADIAANALRIIIAAALWRFRARVRLFDAILECVFFMWIFPFSFYSVGFSGISIKNREKIKVF